MYCKRNVIAEDGRTWQSTANINRNSAQLQDTYFTFATRAEARPNASIEFTPDDFINDYRSVLAATSTCHDLRAMKPHKS